MILKTEVPPVNMNAAVHHASRRAQKKFAENIQKKKNLRLFMCTPFDRQKAAACTEREAPNDSGGQVSMLRGTSKRSAAPKVKRD